MRMARAFDGMSQNQPDRAIAQLQAIVRQQPNFAQAHYALGQEFFRIGRYPQAEAGKRVIEMNRKTRCAIFLGTRLSEREAPSRREEFVQRDVNGRNSAADGHYGIGMALADEEKYQPAIDEFKTAIRLGPQSSGVYFELGRSYASLKMYDEAIAAYLQEKEKDGDDPEVETALGEAYEAKGMTQQAQDARNKAAQLKSGTGR